MIPAVWWERGGVWHRVDGYTRATERNRRIRAASEDRKRPRRRAV